MTLLPFKDSKPLASVDLFCLPYAGGSSAVFRDWDSIFPDWISVRPVEYPGRGTRMGQRRIEVPEDLVSSLLADLMREVRRPWAIFGHSLGAALGYELAKTPTATYPLVGFFPAGRHGPNCSDPAPRRSHLAREALIDEVRRLNGSPTAVLANAELLELMLPIIRSDFLLSERISKCIELKALSCPVHVFGGSDDPEVPQDTLSAWRATAGAGFGTTIVEGDHFFLQDDVCLSQMRSTIVETLGQAVASQSCTETADKVRYG